MERVLLEGGYMSPIQVDKTKPICYKSVPKIIGTSSNEIEKVTATNQNKDFFGDLSKGDISGNQMKANDKNEENITRVTAEKNAINTYEENSSSVNIEKHILCSSTPIKAINVISNRTSDNEVPSKDTFDYYADCRESSHSHKRKSTFVKEENDKSILRRTPPLIKFPPRKRRTY